MKYLIAILGIPLSLGAGWYVYQDSLAHRKRSPNRNVEEAVAVHVTQVSNRTMKETVQLVGRLEPRAQSVLRAETTGYITAIPKDIGDPVNATEQVIQLDQTKYKQAVESAKAALNVAKAKRDVVVKERKPAETKVAKFREAFEKGAITRQELDDAEAELAVLKEREKLEEQNVQSAQTELNIREKALEETRIVSKLKGVVAERFVEIGDLARPDDPLLRVVDLETVKLVVSVVERDYGKVRIGQSAEVKVDAFRGESFIGRVIRKAPVLDVDTRTGMVQIEVPNPKRLLKPGMTARAEIIIQRRTGTPVLPIAALIDRNEEQIVFVVEGSPPRTQPKTVKVGIHDGDFVEILHGIQPTDRVITLGNRLVKPGQLVEPVDRSDRPTSNPKDKKIPEEAGGG